MMKQLLTIVLCTPLALFFLTHLDSSDAVHLKSYPYYEERI